MDVRCSGCVLRSSAGRLTGRLGARFALDADNAEAGLPEPEIKSLCLAIFSCSSDALVLGFKHLRFGDGLDGRRQIASTATIALQSRVRAVRVDHALKDPVSQPDEPRDQRLGLHERWNSGSLASSLSGSKRWNSSSVGSGCAAYTNVSSAF